MDDDQKNQNRVPNTNPVGQRDEYGNLIVENPAKQTPEEVTKEDLGVVVIPESPKNETLEKAEVEIGGERDDAV